MHITVNPVIIIITYETENWRLAFVYSSSISWQFFPSSNYQFVRLIGTITDVVHHTGVCVIM